MVATDARDHHLHDARRRAAGVSNGLGRAHADESGIAWTRRSTQPASDRYGRAATEPGGSMRDAPLLDREGRRMVFLGRAYDALGWAQFKKQDSRGAVENL